MARSPGGRNVRSVVNHIPIHDEAVGKTPQRATYNAWARHYNECERCNKEHDWMNPGSPIVRAIPPKDKAFLWTEKLINGRSYWVSWQPNTSVLCEEGRQIFDQWRAANLIASAPPRTKPTEENEA